MAVRHPGDDDRPTVDLGPQHRVDGDHDGDTEADDLEAAQEPEPAPTATVMPPVVVDLHAQSTADLPRRRASTDSHQTKFSMTASPVEAMRLEEIARTQVFLKVAIFTCLAGLIGAFTTSGDPIAFRVVMLGCILTTIGAAWMLHVTRDPATYGPRRVLGPALVIAFGSYGGVYYWGAGSPVAAMIVYGIYFFSLGSNGRVTTGMYIVVALLHLVLGGGIAAGLLVDRGIVNMTGLKTFEQVAVLLVVEFLYFIAFYTGRVSQRVTLDAVHKLEQAVRGVAQREALLAEARAELDRALKIGGPGRFTDQTVGSFKLGVLIGRGGMGEVYEARTPDGGEAAVKLLHPGALGDPTHVQRFIREAKTSAKLDSPNVVRVLEVGTTVGEVPFLAMERLRGHDLAHQLRRQRKLALEPVRQLVEQVAAGLEAARAGGIVHRDLKPHNVFHADQGNARVWKVLDFGVSKHGSTGTLTKGHVIGTPAYMAPEQAKGEDVDHRADVYSLAAIVYRAVTGHPAFSGKDVPTTLYDVVYRVPTQPSILAQLPGDVDRVLAVGLAKDRRDRIATAGEFAAWFTAAIGAGLTPEQRRRADDVAAKQPWGTRQGTASIG